MSHAHLLYKHKDTTSHRFNFHGFIAKKNIYDVKSMTLRCVIDVKSIHRVSERFLQFTTSYFLLLSFIPHPHRSDKVRPNQMGLCWHRVVAMASYTSDFLTWSAWSSGDLCSKARGVGTAVSCGSDITKLIPSHWCAERNPILRPAGRENTPSIMQIPVRGVACTKHCL